MLAMRRYVFFAAIFMAAALTSGFPFFQTPDESAQRKSSNTIVADEIESYLFTKNESKRFEGQYQVTYYLDGDTVVKERILDHKSSEIKADNTVFQIQRQLVSDPTNPSPWSSARVIRAVGQTTSDEMEILSITDDFVISAKSSRDQMLVSRARRLK